MTSPASFKSYAEVLVCSAPEVPIVGLIDTCRVEDLLDRPRQLILRVAMTKGSVSVYLVEDKEYEFSPL